MNSMYAIIETGDKQYQVERGMILEIPLLEAEEGTALEFDHVLLCSNGEDVLVGTPYVEDAKVQAVCLGETKGEKVVIFKKKRRKNYARKTGHRQEYTRVKINMIVSPISATEPEEEPVEKVQAEATGTVETGGTNE